MGHAYPEKVSKFINARLREAWAAQKHVTITELVDGIFANKIKLSTGEGLYGGNPVEDRPIISHCVEQMMDMMYSNGEVDPRPQTREQKRIWKQWKDGGVETWDSGNDGKSGEYGTFDSIPWWPLKRRFWVIRRMEN
jgi:hypothetical protein